MTVGKATTYGYRALKAIAKKEVPAFQGPVKAGSGGWGHLLERDLGGIASTSVRGNARVLNGLVERGFMVHNPEKDRDDQPGRWFELTDKGVAKCKEILAEEKQDAKVS